MKKRSVLILGMLAVALVLVLAGCPNTGGGSSGSSDPAYSGKFTMGDTDVLFELDNAGSSSASLSIVGGRSLAVTDSTSITGKLKDPSGVRQLRGTYDRASGAFEVSADGNSRYRISGTFDSNKQVLAANALVDNKTNTATRLTMSEVVPRSGAIGGGGVEMAETLPDEFWGTWSFTNSSRTNDDWPGTSKAILLLSPYTLYNADIEDVAKPGNGTVHYYNEFTGGVLVEISGHYTDDPTCPNGYYNAIFVIPGLADDLDAEARAQVDVIFQKYLSSKNIVATRYIPGGDPVADIDWNWSSPTATEYQIEQNGGIYCHNFPEGTVGPDWSIPLSRWRRTLTNEYIKFKLWIDSSGTLHVGLYEGVFFSTLAEAQDAVDSGGEYADGFTPLQ